AYNMHKTFIPIRKKGKLPRETASISYLLEYGSATIEVHRDDVKPGMKVVIVDDLIATGGSLEAASHLLESLKASVVKIITLIELKGLNGRAKLGGYPFDSVVAFEGK
ncbi:MAG: adenine phosphoribosyltransferase, partial [Clostridia bacterium]|nr:adenine phosphoribosyltransferase [Clostridia bacterium]